MIASFRILGYLTLLTTVLIGVHRAQPDWVRSWQDPEMHPVGGVLSPASPLSVVLARRIQAKSEVIKRLRAEEMSFFEAAAWFRSINAAPEEYSDRNVMLFLGDSIDEKTCRQVIAWMTGHGDVAMSESEKIEVECRLEQEMAQHIAEHGRVVLPGWE